MASDTMRDKPSEELSYLGGCLGCEDVKVRGFLTVL